MQKIAGTPSVIKQANRLLILELIQKQPGITKPELARATNLSLVTVSRTVDELVQSGRLPALLWRAQGKAILHQ